ncbi:MAG TPA: K(+)-transporting ATPase subunit C [Segetibacter sp.]|jgi:K+-transporting ATPase ATPase C chain
MKQNILPAIKFSILLLVVFAVIYPIIIWVAAQAAPNNGRGEVATVNGKVVGYTNEGQNFSDDKYFWSRPSAVSYNAAGSGGSNKGPNNADYLQVVNDRLDTFLVHNPTVRKEQVPVELVTASGSGIDPHVSPQGALVQVERVAKARNISVNRLKQLVDEQIEKPLLGMFGTSTINVLKLNIELDKLK